VVSGMRVVTAIEGGAVAAARTAAAPRVPEPLPDEEALAA